MTQAIFILRLNTPMTTLRRDIVITSPYGLWICFIVCSSSNSLSRATGKYNVRLQLHFARSLRKCGLFTNNIMYIYPFAMACLYIKILYLLSHTNPTYYTNYFCKYIDCICSMHSSRCTDVWGQCAWPRATPQQYD